MDKRSALSLERWIAAANYYAGNHRLIDPKHMARCDCVLLVCCCGLPIFAVTWLPIDWKLFHKKVEVVCPTWCHEAKIIRWITQVDFCICLRGYSMPLANRAIEFFTAADEAFPCETSQIGAYKAWKYEAFVQKLVLIQFPSIPPLRELHLSQ